MQRLGRCPARAAAGHHDAVDFFPASPGPPDEPDDHPQPVWANPPEDVLPGVVPVELVLGRSSSTVVLLTGMRAYPSGLQMDLGVRVRGPLGRRDLGSEVFDGPFRHGMGSDWQARRLKWGFELADEIGRASCRERV